MKLLPPHPRRKHGGLEAGPWLKWNLRICDTTKRGVPKTLNLPYKGGFPTKVSQKQSVSSENDAHLRSSF